MLCRGVKEPGSSPARKESKQKEEKVAAADKGAAEKEKVVKERSRSKSGEEYILYSFIFYWMFQGGGRKRSVTPPPTKIHIGRLTRNVNREHLQEIFGTFGKIKDIEFGSERMRPWLNKGETHRKQQLERVFG